MRCLRAVAFALLATLLCAVSASYTGNQTALAAQSKTEKKETKVWVNTASGVYHCPGTRWYGTTKRGKYTGECAAIKDGNRPAYGKACSSECSK